MLHGNIHRSMFMPWCLSRAVCRSELAQCSETRKWSHAAKKGNKIVKHRSSRSYETHHMYVTSVCRFIEKMVEPSFQIQFKVFAELPKVSAIRYTLMSHIQAVIAVLVHDRFFDKYEDFFIYIHNLLATKWLDCLILKIEWTYCQRTVSDGISVLNWFL